MGLRILDSADKDHIIQIQEVGHCLMDISSAILNKNIRLLIAAVVAVVVLVLFIRKEEIFSRHARAQADLFAERLTIVSKEELIMPDTFEFRVSALPKVEREQNLQALREELGEVFGEETLKGLDGQLFIESYFGYWGERDLVIIIDQDLQQMHEFNTQDRRNQSSLVFPPARGKPVGRFDNWGGPAVKIMRDHIAKTLGKEAR